MTSGGTLPPHRQRVSTGGVTATPPLYEKINAGYPMVLFHSA
jgi:hypothetical protein